jgi:hypothetical protein
MTDSLPALGFLFGLLITPTLIVSAMIWAALHFTNSGVLVARGPVMTVAAAGDSPKKVVECSYVTGRGVVAELFDHGDYGYRGRDACPLLIDLAA